MEAEVALRLIRRCIETNHTIGMISRLVNLCFHYIQNLCFIPDISLCVAEGCYCSGMLIHKARAFRTMFN